jgi:hypothetical protein
MRLVARAVAVWLTSAVSLAAALLCYGVTVARPARAALPADAQQALDQGKMAAGQKDWPVAIDYFDQARRSALSEAQPLYYLGLAETQIRGRELRAICWLEAFLALAPKDAEADHVRAVINEMEVRVRSNLNRVRHFT